MDEGDRLHAMVQLDNQIRVGRDLARFPPKERAALRARLSVAKSPRQRLDMFIAKANRVLRNLAAARAARRG